MPFIREPQPVSPQETAVEEVITTETAAAEQETPDAVSGYHIIAGAYMVPDNAEKQKQILENRGFKSIILPPQGSYYMVSLGSYRTLEQVTDVMNSPRDELEIPLWVKKI
jgi:cell division protein FtsN